jgi:hypothetical protein
MNPALSNYSLFFKTLRTKGLSMSSILNTKEGAG